MINYTAEAIGVALLILGDGVVANVLLARSKGEKSGWIVIPKTDAAAGNCLGCSSQITHGHPTTGGTVALTRSGRQRAGTGE